MFENLSERLSGVFDRLTKQGALSEDDVKTALREVRVALLEADVALPVVRDFVDRVRELLGDEEQRLEQGRLGRRHRRGASPEAHPAVAVDERKTVSSPRDRCSTSSPTMRSSK